MQAEGTKSEGRVMDAASVWVEYLRELAMEAQADAAVAAHWANHYRPHMPPRNPRRNLHIAQETREARAHRAGIIAREAYRQWAAAVIVLAQDAGTEDPERHGWRVGVMSDVLGCIEDDEP